MIFHRINDSGRYIATVVAAPESMQFEDPDKIFIGNIDPLTQYHSFELGRPVDMPTKPSLFHTFNYTTKQWEDLRSLQELKEVQWSSIKKARIQSEYSGVIYDGSMFDSDPSSQARITSAVTLALIAKQAGQPYSITWTLSNGTLRTLSADEMIAVGLALGTYVQTNFNKGQLLQQQLAQATTREEVESITW